MSWPPGTGKGRPGKEAASHVKYAEPLYQTAESPATARTIFVRPAGAKFTLRIVPPLVGEDLDRVFDTFEQARNYAGGLRACRGYLIDALAPKGAAV